MATQITTAFVKQYEANVRLLLQQMGSRLRDKVILSSGKRGEEVYMDAIGSTKAQRVTTRYADSPLILTPHTRRRVTPIDFDWGELVDNPDKLRMIIDPTSTYAQNAALAMGREIDDLIIDAAFGTVSMTTTDGSSATASQTFAEDNGETVAVNHWEDLAGINYQGGTAPFHTTSGASTYTKPTSDSGLTIDKLIKTRTLLAENEADDFDFGGPGGNLFIVCSANQLRKLMNDPRVQSADYSTLRALVAGEVNSFMGFQFIRTEQTKTSAQGVTRLTDSTLDEEVLAFHRAGIGLCVWADMVTRIEERADKRFSNYLYMSMTMGAVRLEGKRVVKILCDNS